MRRRVHLETGGRSIPVTWLDPVAASPIEVATGSILLAALGLIGLVWGAAVGSAWFVNGQRLPLGVDQAALATARFGINDLAWDGVWPPDVEQALAGPVWFWTFFAAEALVLALLFWPAWRLLGPRAADPMSVVVEQAPPKHPRAARREAALLAAEQERAVRPDLPGPPSAVPPSLGPSLDKILVPRPRRHRLVLGRAGKELVATESYCSVIVFGPTGSGKTTALTVPAILEWDGPVLVVSAKSDVVTTTWRERAKGGGRTWLFDPASSMAHGRGARGPTTRRAASQGWSPLHRIEAVPQLRHEPELDRRLQQWGLARRTAQWMVGAAKAGGDQGPVPEPWYLVAEQLLGPMLLAAAADQLTVGDVVGWIDRRDTGAVDEALARTAPGEARAAWHGANSHDAATGAGAYQILAMAMAPYGDPTVLRQSRSRDISATELLTGEANTLYVLTPHNHQQRLRPLVSTLVSEVVDTAMSQAIGSPAGQLEAPLLVVFDDAAAVAPLGLLDRLASAGAGLGIQLMTMFADLGEVERVLGAERAAQLATNHRARVVLPGVADGATLDHLGSVIRGTRMVSPGRAGGAGGAASDPATGPPSRWMRTLAEGDALCVYGSLPPIRMALRPWYADADLRNRIEPPAEPRRRLRLRRRRQPLIGGGFPNPLDSDANDREAARYWEQVMRDGTLPEPLTYDDGGGPAEG